MRVTESTRPVIEKEFPWIAKYLSGNLHPDLTFNVQRIDLDTLDIGSHWNHFDSPSAYLLWYQFGRQVSLHNKQGRHMGDIGVRVEKFQERKYLVFGKFEEQERSVTFEETVRSALARISGANDELGYVLIREFQFINGYHTLCSVTVCKLPRSYKTLTEWHADMQKNLAATLAVE